MPKFLNSLPQFPALALAGATLAAAQSPALAADPQQPWRLSKAASLPAWLDISGTHRARYETLDGQFRSGRPGGDQAAAFRTTLRADLKYQALGATAELLDSRHELSDSGSPIDTTMVNTLELLQAYASFRFHGPGSDDSAGELRLGRQTIDLGSRRLVARNSFRNTLNAFTGAQYQMQFETGPALRAFYLLPIHRLPSDPPSLLDNQTQLDQESFDVQFWGLHSLWNGLPLGGAGELYLFGLHEQDSDTVPSRNRELYTPGLRFHRAKAAGAWDFDFESALQFGVARNSSSPADTANLDHFAHFHHAETGYTFAQSWSPRLALIYDYASGDNDPDDRKSNRFDTLYGARRFDHGPTGIYGAFARGNLQSPGLSIGAKPVPTVETEVKYRPYWLASNTDAWTTSGVRDATGNSGSFIGHQIEASARWDILPGNLRLEIGGARLFAGAFAETAPNASANGDSTYGYASLELRF